MWWHVAYGVNRHEYATNIVDKVDAHGNCCIFLSHALFFPHGGAAAHGGATRSARTVWSRVAFWLGRIVSVEPRDVACISFIRLGAYDMRASG